MVKKIGRGQAEDEIGQILQNEVEGILQPIKTVSGELKSITREAEKSGLQRAKDFPEELQSLGDKFDKISKLPTTALYSFDSCVNMSLTFGEAYGLLIDITDYTLTVSAKILTHFSQLVGCTELKPFQSANCIVSKIKLVKTDIVHLKPVVIKYMKKAGKIYKILGEQVTACIMDSEETVLIGEIKKL